MLAETTLGRLARRQPKYKFVIDPKIAQDSKEVKQFRHGCYVLDPFGPLEVKKIGYNKDSK
jgi:hypothetical protein